MFFNFNYLFMYSSTNHNEVSRNPQVLYYFRSDEQAVLHRAQHDGHYGQQVSVPFSYLEAINDVMAVS